MQNSIPKLDALIGTTVKLTIVLQNKTISMVIEIAKDTGINLITYRI